MSFNLPPGTTLRDIDPPLRCEDCGSPLTTSVVVQSDGVALHYCAAHAPEKRARCPGCGNEIDPEVCWCGDFINGHPSCDGHSPVPMGCECGRAREDCAPSAEPNKSEDEDDR